MNVKELIELNDQITKICGWKSTNNVELGYNLMENGDRYIYQDIYPERLDNFIPVVKEIESQILALSKDIIKSVSMYERDEETDPYRRFYVSVELTI